MRIDLRYPIVVASFYAPGVMMLIGAWALGYTMSEVRDVIAVGGAMGGVATSLVCIAILFSFDKKPIWWEVKRRE